MNHLVKGNSIYSIKMYQLRILQLLDEAKAHGSICGIIIYGEAYENCQTVIDAYNEMCY